MEVQTLEALVKVIKDSDIENAVEMIKTYGNMRETRGISSGWSRSRVVMRFAMKNRKKRLKNSVLEFDEYAGMLSLISFTRLISAQENIIRDLHEKGSFEVRVACAEISDATMQLLGDVKLDRRIIYSKGD
ncbi:MAG: hypothetical protein KAQ85_06430 [Thermodesulfovibrionia bacterium]|nr:hypothetical protein [Thermodesulfovibrionia bacterium]